MATIALTAGYSCSVTMRGICKGCFLWPLNGLPKSSDLTSLGPYVDQCSYWRIVSPMLAMAYHLKQSFLVMVEMPVMIIFLLAPLC
jgi:hypothetical protein